MSNFDLIRPYIPFWDWLTFLWNSALEFMNLPIIGMGINCTLWQFALGFAILDLILFAVFRALE